MHLELTEYCQQKLPKHQSIDQRLTPILRKVRFNHINSIHQLQDDFITVKSQRLEKEHLKSKNKKVFQGRRVSQQTKKQGEKDQMFLTAKGKFFSTLESKNKRFSKTVNIPRKRDEENINIINPLSKIKKHLIEHIDFQELQTAMHQKSTTLNLYESFCEKLKEKRPSRQKRIVSQTTRVLRLKDGSVVESDDGQLDTIYDPEESSFRISHRKRFWRGGFDYRRREIEDKDGLKVKGVGSTIV